MRARERNGPMKVRGRGRGRGRVPVWVNGEARAQSDMWRDTMG